LGSSLDWLEPLCPDVGPSRHDPIAEADLGVTVSLLSDLESTRATTGDVESIGLAFWCEEDVVFIGKP
jgi:hypothetical protein